MVLNSACHIKIILKQLHFNQDLNLFICKIFINYNKATEFFDKWWCKFIDQLKNELLKNKRHIKYTGIKNLNNDKKDLQSKFIIIYVDKSPFCYCL